MNNINSLKIGDKVKYYDKNKTIKIRLINNIEKDCFVLTEFVGESFGELIPKKDIISKLVKMPVQYEEIDINHE